MILNFIKKVPLLTGGPESLGAGLFYCFINFHNHGCSFICSTAQAVSAGSQMLQLKLDIILTPVEHGGSKLITTLPSPSITFHLILALFVSLTLNTAVCSTRFGSSFTELIVGPTGGALVIQLMPLNIRNRHRTKLAGVTNNLPWVGDPDGVTLFDTTDHNVLL